jgi:hypothetical protein
MLAVPLVTGAATGLLAGGHAASLAPLAAAVLALFWLRTPVESWLGVSAMKARTAAEFQLVRRVAARLAAVAAASAVWLFWGGRNLQLLWIGAAAAFAFVAQAVVKQRGRENREASQIVGAAGLTAVAPAAYYVVTGGFHGPAWELWAANLLFAVNQIQFVQLRIRGAHAATFADKLALGRGFVTGQMLLLVLLACGVFPWYAALSFAPIVWRGFAWFVSGAQTLAVHSLGKRELVYACVFGVMLVGGLAM